MRLERVLPPLITLFITLTALSTLYLIHTLSPLSSAALPLLTLLTLVLTSYLSACSTPPGRLARSVPPSTVPALCEKYPSVRWCIPCAAPKPSRAHHCAVCRACIPRMDHHCPWLATCIGLANYAHFARFLLFANLGLAYVIAQLAVLFRNHVWREQRLPAYLGPAAFHVALLVGTGAAAVAAEIFVGLMGLATAWDLLQGRTTVEAKEMATYESVVERRKSSRGWWGDQDSGSGSEPEGSPFEEVEFPYELGLFGNLAEAMGSRNPLWWIWPFAASPRVDPDGSASGVGWRWLENGDNPRQGMWPPPEVVKSRRGRTRKSERVAVRTTMVEGDGVLDQDAFRQRQRADLERRAWPRKQGTVMHQPEESDSEDDLPLATLAQRKML